MALTLTVNMENLAMYKDIRRNLVTMYVNSLDQEELSDLFLSLYQLRPDNQDELSSTKRKIIRFLCNPSYQPTANASGRVNLVCKNTLELVK